MYIINQSNGIASVITGIERSSANRKTGAMLQAWHILTSMSPVEAIKTGADALICGSCPLRGNNGKQRACYVNTGQAPNAVYRGLANAKPLDYNLLKNHVIRWGAYGDTALSLPYETVAELSSHARGWTGYTHQWRTCDQRFKQYLMASCDTEQDYHDAKRLGWRTFRVKRESEAKLKNEIICPASSEAGNKTTCIECRLCNGMSGKLKRDVVINAHGTGAKHT